MTTNLTVKKLVTVAALVAIVLGSAGYAVAQVIGRDRVLAFDTDRWTVWAPAGAGQIVVDGDGDTDLDCFVYDRFGQLLGMDNDRTDYCIVDFRQRTSGDIRVEIRNLGRVYNEYTLSLR
jgi:hypothetical protein